MFISSTSKFYTLDMLHHSIPLSVDDKVESGSS